MDKDSSGMETLMEVVENGTTDDSAQKAGADPDAEFRPESEQDAFVPDEENSPEPVENSPEPDEESGAALGLYGIDDEDRSDYILINQSQSGEDDASGAEDEPAEIGAMDLIFEKINDMSQKVDELQNDFNSKLKYDVHKEKIIDALHKELQQHKDGLVKKHIQSMVFDLIKVVDDIRKIVKYYREKELSDSDLPKLINILEELPSDLEDLFSYQGIIPYSCEGGAFDPLRQRVLQKIETSDEALDKVVAKSILPGYEWEGKILRPETVIVYTYKPVLDQTEA